MKISVQEKDFDLSTETLLLSKDKRVGAVASFVGLVREVPMTLEHYPGMTENAIAKIAEEAGGRWEGMGFTLIHRHGAPEAGGPKRVGGGGGGHSGAAPPPPGVVPWA